MKSTEGENPDIKNKTLKKTMKKLQGRNLGLAM